MMREQVRTMIDEAKRGADSDPPDAPAPVENSMKHPSQRSELLAADTIRLARLATSIHLSRTTELMAEQPVNRLNTSGGESHCPFTQERVR